jgi:two-component system phosphate regulon sensor histidine kinase PhoR
MFFRLFFPLVILLLVILAGLGIALAVDFPDPAQRAQLLLHVAGAAVIGSGLAVLVCLGVARAVGQPIDELIRHAAGMESSNLGQRVFIDSPPELASLGQELNRLNTRLATRFSQLEQDHEQLKAILGGMVEGVVALDARQHVLFANERAHQLLELTDSPVGRPLWEVVRQRPLLDAVQKAVERGGPCEEELSWAGREPRSLTLHAARLTGRPPRGAVLVLHDTTELRRLERLRQDFVANVSHELKTPLSVIQACVETLLDGAIDDPQHREPFLKQIASQSERLHTLILDLLSLARIESGEELFELKAVPVEALVRAGVERHQARAETRRQTLSMDPPADAAGLCIWADEDALDQILDNLLDNAVKYTPEGGKIRIGWRLEGGQVCLEVTDTGIGIPETDLPRIFERFYRVDKARSRELGGTGLGLSIVKHLVQALRGSVRAASRVGHGTTFTVRLPRALG